MDQAGRDGQGPGWEGWYTDQAESDGTQTELGLDGTQTRLGGMVHRPD